MSRPSPVGPDPSGVGYVLTHYPAPSHTFIDREILALEAQGLGVRTFVINTPAPGEVMSSADQVANDRSTYLKTGSLLSVTRALAATARRNPGGVLGAIRLAVTSSRGNMPVLAKRLAHLAEGMLVADAARRDGIRHLHAHFGLTPAMIAWFATLTAAPGTRPATWSMTIHGYDDFTNERENMLGQKVGAASFVVAASDFIASQVKRVARPADWHKVTVVRCGLDLADFPLREPLCGATAAHLPVVVHVARFSAEKGHLVLLEAVARLHARGTPVRVRLIGSGPLEPEIRNAIESLGLTDAVDLLGAQPPSVVRDELERADFFVLPSFSEGLPISLMEAMAVGVPVIASGIAGIPELVRHGVTGWTVPPGRPDLLADCILEALDRNTDETVKAARSLVEDDYDIHRNAVALNHLMSGLSGA